ncbi:MAG: ParA family protein [Mycoplasmatales bacterium]
MQIIANYNNKGGVGKTTTTKMLHKYLTKFGNKVLLIDVDPQGNLSSNFIKEEEIKISTHDLLLTNIDFKDCITITQEDVHIIPATMKLHTAGQELMLKSMSSNVATILNNKIKQSNLDYDYIIIDCPPTMDLLVTNVLAVADKVFVPINADNYSVEGLKMLLKYINTLKTEWNDNLVIGGIYLNKHKNSKTQNDFYDQLQKAIPTYLLNQKIGDYVAIGKDTYDDTALKGHKVLEQFEELFKEMKICEN